MVKKKTGGGGDQGDSIIFFKDFSGRHLLAGFLNRKNGGAGAGGPFQNTGVGVGPQKGKKTPEKKRASGKRGRAKKKNKTKCGWTYLGQNIKNNRKKMLVGGD